jgi:hypothetical protein
MSDEIGLVIAKGMQVLFKTNPKNPVDFLAKWLLNTSKVNRETAAQRLAEEKFIAAAQAARAEEEIRIQYQKDLVQISDLKWSDKNASFKSSIDKSNDLCDQMQLLNDHLSEGTNATAVYIGKIVQPKKPITDADNDKAHIDKSAPAHIHFSYANPDHQFLVDQILEPGKMTFEIFEEEKPLAEGEVAPVKDELDDEGNPVPKMQLNEGEELPNHFVVPEVVREPKMHFFKVPRLGSYMAIRLEY